MSWLCICGEGGFTYLRQVVKEKGTEGSRDARQQLGLEEVGLHEKVLFFPLKREGRLECRQPPIHPAALSAAAAGCCACSLNKPGLYKGNAMYLATLLLPRLADQLLSLGQRWRHLLIYTREGRVNLCSRYPVVIVVTCLDFEHGGVPHELLCCYWGSFLAFDALPSSFHAVRAVSIPVP